MARLITIPVSHYCEKARWALDLAHVPYAEDGWAPVAHRLPLRRLGATTAPVLVTDEGAVLRESTDIVRYADEAGAPRLFGDGPDERAEIEALVARFDERVGPSARLLVYAGLLDQPDAFVRTIGAGLAPRRAWQVRAGRPLIAAAIRRFFGVDAEAARRCEAQLDEELRFADEQRAGSRFLVGQRFSAADLTFAALLAPVVYPDGYGAPVPPLEEMPAAYRENVARWAATPSATVVRDLYAGHRHPPVH